jgi:hypothetical protein
MAVDITRLRGIRYHPPLPPDEWARRARAVIDNRSAVRGFMEDANDPVGNVRRVVPDAFRIFGEATITAAAAPLAPGVCRWCLAVSHARVHRLPVPAVTQATRLLLGNPCRRHRRETLVAAAGDFGKPSYAAGTYEAVAKGGRLGLGKRVIDGPPSMADDQLDSLKHYVRVWGDGSVNVLHSSACALQPGRCPLDNAMLVQGGLLDVPSVPQADSARQVSTAFTASAAASLAARVRGGPPTPVKPLTASARNLAAMKRMGVKPETYFGPGFTTQEQDAALGAFIRRTYPGRRRRVR